MDRTFSWRWSFRCWVLAGVAGLGLQAGPACAAGRSDGLADADRVLREVRAANAAGTLHQRQATLLVLAGAARRAVTHDGAKPQPDDLARVAGYQRAMQDVLTEAAKSGPPDCRGDMCPAARLSQSALVLAGNPVFAQGVLERFATPAWRQTYMVLLTPRAGAASTPSVATPAATAAEAAPAPARETEAPRAAKSPSGVDMLAFGIPMGEPLRLPRCAPPANAQAAGLEALAGMAGMAEGPKATCQTNSGAAALMAGDDGVAIRLSRDRCPDWVHISQVCSLIAKLQGGRLAAVVVVTRGLETDEQVARDLQAKYGKPTRVQKRTWSNRNGGRWEVEELTWDLKDLLVEYRPMGKSDDAGSIAIVTAEGRRFLEAETQRQDAKRPKL